MAYEIKGKTTKITATSRCALKVNDNFYTLQLEEEREIVPDDKEIRLDLEYKDIFDNINAEIDNQIQDVLNNIQ